MAEPLEKVDGLEGSKVVGEVIMPARTTITSAARRLPRGREQKKTVEQNDEIIDGTCWLACFDLLGSRRRVRAYAERRYAKHPNPGFSDGLSILVGKDIEKTIRTLEEELAHQSRFRAVPWYYAHFSDTFVLYVPDDSRDSFETLESAAGNFFHNRVLDRAPLRGALTCGRFYADRARGIFVGPALMDAYDCAEKQDWIGYVLTRQAVKRLSELQPPIKSPGNYVWWRVPVKGEKAVSPCGKKMTKNEAQRHLAFQLGTYNFPNTRRLILDMNRQARNESKEEADNVSRGAKNGPRETPNTWRDYYKRCRSKYVNTLLFMKYGGSMEAE